MITLESRLVTLLEKVIKHYEDITILDSTDISNLIKLFKDNNITYVMEQKTAPETQAALENLKAGLPISELNNLPGRPPYVQN